MKWTKETESASERRWEELYRNRFQHDKRVRTTHGVNCTGSCSWEVFVKDGIVSWELQATDYPKLEDSLPPYEPRGCQRGCSFSWYLYSPLRVKHPYIRGALLDLWRQARREHGDPVAAWRSITDDHAKRRLYQEARGKGGLRRVSWDEVTELIAASTIHTVKEHGPDRVVGFSPIPAMSQVSYAAGSRFLTLLGGVAMSFYDWYCDLPNASPEIWGEQTDVHESADWFNAKHIAIMGSNLNMTRTPDTHFMAEARHAGAKVTVFSPDFSMVSKYADEWMPLHLGQDGAFWMAVNHVILTEYYSRRQVPYFNDYLKRFTDMPFLVEIDDAGSDGAPADAPTEAPVAEQTAADPTSSPLRPGRCFRAGRLPGHEDLEHGEWKLLVWDETSGTPRPPKGTIGYRWASGDDKGKWNLQMEDGATGVELRPELSFLDRHDALLDVQFDAFAESGAGGGTITRSVPVRYVETAEGRVAVTTVFDLTMAQFGVGRGLGGDYPATYDDDLPYTPAWQEKYTGIARDAVTRFAREWAENGEKTKGKNMIIIGAGVNHWYHNNLIYRAAIVSLMLTGSVGVNGGGLAHYVGQEKVVSQASWSSVAFALDWGMVPRHQNSPSFHYVHSDQWRYERGYGSYDSLPGGAPDHTIDHQVRAVRRGWLPFFPQFDRSPFQVAREARAAGATDGAGVVEHVRSELEAGRLGFAVEDPDAPTSWPRLWFIWRGNAIGTSAKGHEYFLKHYLGTHTALIAEECAAGHVNEVTCEGQAPIGKMDLVVDLNFRMDTSALYSDIVLPAATWYEKDDINTTDMHTFINPMQAAVAPAWESKSDWDIFKAIARKVSDLARTHLPEPQEDVVMLPLQHDTPDEISQPRVVDWSTGEVPAIPGVTMPKFRVVDRDYVNLYERMVSLGSAVEQNGVAAHGLTIPVADMYADLRDRQPRRFRGPGGATYPSLETARDVAEVILYLDPASNGELAHRAFEAEEHKTGLSLTDLGAGSRDTRISFADIVSQPRRVLTTPTWSALINNGRAYAPFTLNKERLVPWRTLTGRQHVYLDHDQYLLWGEHLPTYKPRPDHTMSGDLLRTTLEGNGRILNYITPHSKWSIHSTFGDNLRMMTLSRGGYPVWMNDKEAFELGIADNDWVELINDHGVFLQRATVSSRIPRGSVFVYHATERTIGVPKSKSRGGRRAGMNNSLNRVKLKPVLMSGGYAQFSYAFNYWGPVGVNRDTFVYVRRVDRPEF
ncbi:MAG: nitrate reductase subunit alpha [Actinobacteria bacterium]|nr:nitrate reductase subunit alpha [Actinomycetota bacterium]